MFSDLPALIHEIVYLHEAPDGFLVQLRNANFDQQLFDQCVDVLEQYHAFVKTERMIDKRVVRFLCDTISILESSASQFHQMQWPAAKRVGDAHSLWLSLIDKLLTIEPPNPNAETSQQSGLL